MTQRRHRLYCSFLFVLTATACVQGSARAQCVGSNTTNWMGRDVIRLAGNSIFTWGASFTTGWYAYRWKGRVQATVRVNGSTIHTGDVQGGWNQVAEIGWVDQPSSVGVGTFSINNTHTFESQCGHDRTEYSDYSLLVQRPTISGVDTIWWLGGGSDPSNGYYNTSALTSDPKGAPEVPIWSVPFGGGKMSLSCSICTSNTATSQAPSSGCQYDITIKVSVGGLNSENFLMSVNQPSYLESLGPPVDAGWNAAGFKSTIPYRIRDHCNNPLSSIAVNEQFGPFVNDTSNNWPKPTPSNTSGFSGPGFSDVIGIWGSYTPQPLVPQSPLTTTKVDHATQTFRVGSSTSGQGVQVQTNTHQKYLDHGRHE